MLLRWFCAPQSKMDKNGHHGCFTPSTLSIVICTFVRYKIPLQKAHVICKIINVQNDAKLAHTNVRAIKSTVGIQKDLQFWQQSEKHPPYKVFDYSVKIYFARYHTPLKNFMDNPPTHNKKEKHTSPCLFSHNKDMNTMICVLQPLFPLCLAQLGHKFTPRHVSPLIVSHMDTLSYVLGSRVRSYVVQLGAKTEADARVALSGAFMLACNKIQNWFTKITGVYRSLPRWS